MEFQREQYESGLKKELKMNSLQKNLVPFVPLVQGTNSTKSTNEHRYSLASNKVKKLDCPYCGAKKHWHGLDNNSSYINVFKDYSSLDILSIIKNVLLKQSIVIKHEVYPHNIIGIISRISPL